LVQIKTMKLKTLFLACFASSNFIFSQAYNGPESVEYDYSNDRWLIGNVNSHEVLARDESGNLTVLIPAGSIGSAGPYGIEIVDNVLYACCGSRVKGFDLTSLDEVFNVNTGGTFLNGITHDSSGNLYVTDFSAKVIYKIDIAAETSNNIASNLVQSPNGIIFDEANNRCVFVNWGANAPIKALDLSDNSVSTIATTNYTNCDGIAQDGNGDFYISIWGGQQVVKYNNNFSLSPVLISQGLVSPADLFFNTEDLVLGIPNSGNNTVTFVSFFLNVQEYTLSSFQIYPNPSITYETTLTWGDETAKPEEISVYNMAGVRLFTFAKNEIYSVENQFKMTCLGLQSGFYVIRVLSEAGTNAIPWVVE